MKIIGGSVIKVTCMCVRVRTAGSRMYLETVDLGFYVVSVSPKNNLKKKNFLHTVRIRTRF